MVLNLPSDYYSPYDVSTCVSVDQDPLNGCAAVNCFHKYNGHRNYFNPAKLRCTPVPRCDSAKPQTQGALPSMVRLRDHLVFDQYSKGNLLR